MPRQATKGTKQLGVEISTPLVDEVRAFAKARGETVREVVEVALRRHIKYPPPPPVPPIPPEPLPLPDVAGVELVKEKPAPKGEPAAGKRPKGKK